MRLQSIVFLLVLGREREAVDCKSLSRKKFSVKKQRQFKMLKIIKTVERSREKPLNLKLNKHVTEQNADHLSCHSVSYCNELLKSVGFVVVVAL